jgi:hypothetical protein
LIKNAIFAILQFVLFMVVFAVGSFLPPFHLDQVLGTTPDGTRIFVWDGVVLMTAVFLLLLIIEAARKRLPTSGPWTAAAFVLAAFAGYAAKFGFLTVEAVTVYRPR